LAPGGIVVLTVDLFLDLSPFTSSSRNEHGANIDLSRFLSDAGLVVIEGHPKELHGFPEFSSEDILRRLQDFYVGRPVPTLTQCLVARRLDVETGRLRPGQMRKGDRGAAWAGNHS
jgi:hypothetical protein